MLVIGGGIAGVWAAIAAARSGAKVIILEKAATERSGAGGAGVDHWQWAADNPASRVSPEELAQALIDNQGGYRSGISHLHPVRLGLGDARGDGAHGRQDPRHRGRVPRRRISATRETKLLFAYDYTNRFVLRVWGHNFKPLLREECGAWACACSTASR